MYRLFFYLYKILSFMGKSCFKFFCEVEFKIGKYKK